MSLRVIATELLKQKFGMKKLRTLEITKIMESGDSSKYTVSIDNNLQLSEFLGGLSADDSDDYSKLSG